MASLSLLVGSTVLIIAAVTEQPRTANLNATITWVYPRYSNDIPMLLDYKKVMNNDFQNVSYNCDIIIEFPHAYYMYLSSLTRYIRLFNDLSPNLLTADPWAVSLIPGRSHTFVEIEYEIISMVNFLPSAESFKKDCCQLHTKVCARSTG